MTITNNKATTGAAAFFARLFCARRPLKIADITDWEFVNNADLSDDDFLDIPSESESEFATAHKAVSFAKDRGLKDGDHDFTPIAVVGIRMHGGFLKVSDEEEDYEDDVADLESDYDQEDVNDLDDELVPWTVTGRFGRERMRKLGTRAFGKMNKTTKKSAYTVNRPGCVRGKHGLGRKATCL